MTRVKSGWALFAAVLLVVVSSMVYLTGLRKSPPYLMHDELQFSLQARSLADTGHDLAGRRWPVFFTEPEFPPGRDPVIIYVTSMALRVLPFSESSVRMPTALVGVLDIGLMFVVGWLVFDNAWLGLLAAALLAFTPIHFIRARLVLSPFYSIPFILSWLIALGLYLRSGSRRALLTGTACIALTVYTYLACTVMAPIYFVTTLVVAMRREGRRVIVPMVAIAAAVLAPMVIWYATHPERYSQLIEAYRLYGNGSASAPVAALAPGTPKGARLWLGLLWQFLNPDFLFLSGDSSLINSTRTAGLFPVAFMALVPVGIWAAWRSTDTLTRVVLIGLVSAPAASLLSGAIEMNRIMFVIPFGALTAAVGARALMAHGRAARVVAAILVASVAIQFATFHRYYLDQYPVRVGTWFGGNVRDAVLEGLKGSGPVFLSANIPMIGRYWAFYSPAGQAARTPNYFLEPPTDAPAGARAVCRIADPACGSLGPASGWQRVAGVHELSGEESFTIFERR